MVNKSNNKILVIIIAVLLLVNTGMVFFILRTPEKPSFHNDFKAAMPEFLQNSIGFSSQQMSQYDSLSNAYNAKFKANMESLRSDRQQEFKQFAQTGFNDSAIDSIVLLATENRKLLDVNLLQYTKEIRKICTPEQQPKYDTLLYKVLNKKN